jgi:hypothetical protein
MRYTQLVLGLVAEPPPGNLHYHNNAKSYKPVDPQARRKEAGNRAPAAALASAGADVRQCRHLTS